MMSPMCKRVLRKRAHAADEAAKRKADEAAKRQKVEADLAELMLCASRAFEERQAEARRHEAAMKHQAEQEILLKFIVTGSVDCGLTCDESLEQSTESPTLEQSESYSDMIRRFKDYEPTAYCAASDAALAKWHADFRVRAWNAHYDDVAAGKTQPFKCYHD